MSLRNFITSSFTKQLTSTTTRRGFASTATAMSTIKAKALLYSQYGEPLDVLKAHTFEISSTPSGDEVLIESVACPVNPSDLNQVQGVYPSRPELSTALGTAEPSAVGGNEGLFKVVSVGEKVAGLKPGDWVIPSSVNFGTWRSHALTAEKTLMKMPKTIPANQAATITVNPSTAYQMLTLYEDLKPGDWFIQNGGNSQVGLAAVQIGKKLGLNSISIVRDRENLSELVEKMTKLGATHVITEEQNGSRDFGKQIEEWTGGKPIKLAMNCVGGTNCTNMVRKLGPDATLLTYGGMSLKPVSIPTTSFIFKNLTAKGFWITENVKRIPGSREATLKEVIKLIEDGDLVETGSQENSLSLDASEEEFLSVFINAIKTSHKGKQLVVFK